MGSFLSQVQWAPNFVVGTTPESRVIGDLNGDGKTDLAAANHNANSVSALFAKTEP